MNKVPLNRGGSQSNEFMMKNSQQRQMTMKNGGILQIEGPKSGGNTRHNSI
jgi:hypothetical protein